MKKQLLMLALTLFCGPIFGQYKFSVDITTKSLANRKFELIMYNNGNWGEVKKVSFTVLNGHHTLSGEVMQPSNFSSIAVFHNGKVTDCNFVIDSGKNNLTVEYPSAGSRLLSVQSTARGNFIFQELNGIFTRAVNSYSGSNDGRYVRRPAELDEQITKDQLKQIQTYPNDFASLLYLYRITRLRSTLNSASENLKAFEKFSEGIKDTALGKQLYKEQTGVIASITSSMEGKMAPIFQVPDLFNKPFSNSLLNGQPYLIVFSATWCLPCQEALPKLKKLYTIYNPMGLRIVYFNDDDDIIRWREHVKTNKLTWINVSEKLKPSQSRIPKSFGVYAIPTYLVVDRNGYIIYNSDRSDVNGNNLEEYIKRAISK